MLPTSARAAASARCLASSSRGSVPLVPVRYSWTLWVPHRKGWNYQEPDIPLKVRLKEGWKVLGKESKKWVEEKKQAITEDPSRHWASLRHNTLHIQWKFDSPKVLEQFDVAADSDGKHGRSQGELVLSKNKTALFRGNLDTAVPKDGKVFRTGYVNISSKRIYKSFYRRTHFEEWHRFTGLSMKIRGDGRSYLICLNSPGSFDTVWHDQFHHPLFIHGGPYWQYVKIPFSKFFLGTHMRIQDKQFPVREGGKISSIGITMCDKVDGPFQLEIEWIGVYYDNTHFERFAYETYDIPLIS